MKTFEWSNKKTGDFKFYLDDNTFITNAKLPQQ